MMDSGRGNFKEMKHKLKKGDVPQGQATAQLIAFCARTKLQLSICHV